MDASTTTTTNGHETNGKRNPAPPPSPASGAHPVAADAATSAPPDSGTHRAAKAEASNKDASQAADETCNVRNLLEEATNSLACALMASVNGDEGYDVAEQVTHALHSVTAAQSELWRTEIHVGGHLRSPYTPEAKTKPPEAMREHLVVALPNAIHERFARQVLEYIEDAAKTARAIAGRVQVLIAAQDAGVGPEVEELNDLAAEVRALFGPIEGAECELRHNFLRPVEQATVLEQDAAE